MYTPKINENENQTGNFIQCKDTNKTRKYWKILNKIFTVTDKYKVYTQYAITRERKKGKKEEDRDRER